MDTWPECFNLVDYIKGNQEPQDSVGGSGEGGVKLAD